MTVIRYTNPRRLVTAFGEAWQCAACSNKYDSADEARACAERDHEARSRS